MTLDNQCKCHQSLKFSIRMAFQPIIDVQDKVIFSYEALVRGEEGQEANYVLSKVTNDNKYSFDQQCRITAIEAIAKLNRSATVNINFLPNAIYEPETCLARVLEVAKTVSFPHDQIIFEVTEHEKITNHSLLKNIFTTYRRMGFRTAIDDFGEGFAGLNLLADFQPDFLKLDMKLIQGISQNSVKQAILSGIQITSEKLGIKLIAEGIETRDDYLFLMDNGIRYMQGYYFAKPALEMLPEIAEYIL
ncbi:diguanylate phosphodiesterase [Rippkaea orientalis PCC 8801]|uniref:Diguanylate phosphodiesterase n=1 Tax=Rippkaea orientalis (strain PCC 8801 / RF-1) TaxID=41431 RepID=B7JZH3_RIPO1|nr:EAL domain-containing protein [Rippkaea orientalis]ACK64133.1 diguanylate phosphodiesterase [Rippkaea orientalis PCC 8801]